LLEGEGRGFKPTTYRGRRKGALAPEATQLQRPKARSTVGPQAAGLKPHPSERHLKLRSLDYVAASTMSHDMKEYSQHRNFPRFVRLAGLHRKFWVVDLWLLTLGFGGCLGAAALAFFLVPSPMGVAGAFQPRVHLPKFAEVEGNTIRLSDLLPPDAPAELGQIGSTIVFGNSPLPASQRVISKDEIELQLRDYPSVLERLELPERLIISCKQRRLSPDEIWKAIETFLAQEGLSIPRTALRDLLGYRSPVLVTRQDPGLVVKRMESDHVRRQIRFSLWTSNEAQVLPFYVTVEERPKRAARASSNNVETGTGGNLADDLEGLGKAERPSSAALFAASRSGRPAQKVELGPRVTSPPIILVTRGKPAKLVVETETLRLTVLVTPLESGAKGQLVRVKNLDTQRVFTAEVVGEGLLQAGLAGE